MEEFIININLLLHERVDIDEKMNVTTARNSAKAGSVSKKQLHSVHKVKNLKYFSNASFAEFLRYFTCCYCGTHSNFMKLLKMHVNVFT